MNKKKIIIIISIIVLLLLILTTIFVIAHNKNNKKQEIKEEPKIEEKIEIPEEKEEKIEVPEETEEPKVEEKKEEVKKEEPKKETTKPSTPTKPTKPSEPTKPTTPTQPTTPTVTYTCPNGYTLNGTKCSITVDAVLDCPSGKHSSSDGNLSGCIDFNEGFETQDSCPSNHIQIKMITLDGTPSKYYCYPVHPKVYTCEQGFTLSGTKCTKTINATKK